jgi:hypothetical protein
MSSLPLENDRSVQSAGRDLGGNSGDDHDLEKLIWEDLQKLFKSDLLESQRRYRESDSGSSSASQCSPIKPPRMRPRVLQDQARTPSMTIRAEKNKSPSKRFCFNCALIISGYLLFIFAITNYFIPSAARRAQPAAARSEDTATMQKGLRTDVRQGVRSPRGAPDSNAVGWGKRETGDPDGDFTRSFEDVRRQYLERGKKPTCHADRVYLESFSEFSAWRIVPRTPFEDVTAAGIRWVSRFHNRLRCNRSISEF